MDIYEQFTKTHRPKFTKSEEDVWAELSKRTVDKKRGQIFKLTKVAAAAVIALLVSSTVLSFCMAEQIVCSRGEHKTVTLPGGSTVSLNAESSIEYNSLFWRFNRKVELTGEAHFDVEKGSRFKVISNVGTTEVLGTKFDIWARGDSYKVYCFSGRVKVSSEGSTADKYLTKGESVSLINGSLVKSIFASRYGKPEWIENRLSFESESVYSVFEEIERQYDVEIDYNRKDLSYTGLLSLDKDALNILDNICKPFGLRAKEVSPSHFTIY